MSAGSEAKAVSQKIRGAVLPGRGGDLAGRPRQCCSSENSGNSLVSCSGGKLHGDQVSKSQRDHQPGNPYFCISLAVLRELSFRPFGSLDTYSVKTRTEPSMPNARNPQSQYPESRTPQSLPRSSLPWLQASKNSELVVLMGIVVAVHLLGLG